MIKNTMIILCSALPPGNLYNMRQFEGRKYSIINSNKVHKLTIQALDLHSTTIVINVGQIEVCVPICMAGRNYWPLLRQYSSLSIYLI